MAAPGWDWRLSADVSAQRVGNARPPADRVAMTGIEGVSSDSLLKSGLSG
jgi:hypothetical protein